MPIFMNPQLIVTVVGFHSLFAYLVVVAVLLIPWPQLWLTLMTLFFGMLAGFIDIHANDPQLPALLLLAGGFFAASVRPRRAWVWPFLLGPWIPLAGFWKAVTLGAPAGGAIAGLVAFVPAFLGAGMGVLVTWGRAKLGVKNSAISLKNEL